MQDLCNCVRQLVSLNVTPLSQSYREVQTMANGMLMY